VTTALAWTGMACRAVAVAICTYVILTGWAPLVDVLRTSRVACELRPIVEPAAPLLRRA
jgi:hypothetical protein